jgi:hypothetical protein
MHGNDRLRVELAKANAECERLRKENAKLRTRLGDNDGRRGAPPVVTGVAIILPNVPAPAHKTSERSSSVTNTPREQKLRQSLRLRRHPSAGSKSNAPETFESL